MALASCLNNFTVRTFALLVFWSVSIQINTNLFIFFWRRYYRLAVNWVEILDCVIMCFFFGGITLSVRLLELYVCKIILIEIFCRKNVLGQYYRPQRADVGWEPFKKDSAAEACRSLQSSLTNIIIFQSQYFNDSIFYHISETVMVYFYENSKYEISIYAHAIL